MPPVTRKGSPVLVTRTLHVQNGTSSSELERHGGECVTRILDGPSKCPLVLTRRAPLTAHTDGLPKRDLGFTLKLSVSCDA